MNNSVNNLGLVLQTLSLIILLKDYNNSDLMRELQNQDTNYFEKLIAQNEKIIAQNELILRQLKEKR